MPIYEFYCEKCKKESEILVRSKDLRGRVVHTAGQNGCRKSSQPLTQTAQAVVAEKPVRLLAKGRVPAVVDAGRL
jgi:predicted nucleic acid-binding Zn ribbon protein